jgi:hypothetical protein
MSISLVLDMALDAKPLPTEKALPVLPSHEPSAMRDSCSLIDATERPLRRSGPDRPDLVEDWPVLTPNKSRIVMALGDKMALSGVVKTSTTQIEDRWRKIAPREWNVLQENRVQNSPTRKDQNGSHLHRGSAVDEFLLQSHQFETLNSPNRVHAEARINNTAGSAQSRQSCTSDISDVHDRVDDPQINRNSSEALGLTRASITRPGFNEDRQTRRNLYEDFANKPLNSMQNEISRNIHSSSGKMTTQPADCQSRTDVPPLSPYTTKRLSAASPEFGPTLRVSSSAARVIMGEGDGNRTNKTVRRVPVPVARETLRARGDHTRTTASNEDRTFPLASQGIRRVHESRIARPTSEARKMRAVSDEAQSALHKEHPKPNPRTVKAVSAGSRGMTLSVGEDPFFDAQPYVEPSPTQTVHPHPESSHRQQQHLSRTATGFEGDTSISSGLEQEIVERIGSTPVRREVPSTIPQEQIGTPAAANVFANGTHDTGHQQAAETTSEFDSHSDQDLAITQLGSFPPRSSSRTTALQFMNQNSPPIPPAPESRELSSDSLLPQNHVASGAGRDSKRSSLPQPSTRSRVLSGVRGLFHKGKKVNVAENGSPLTSVPEACPAHRATVASETRRAANLRAPVTAAAAIRGPVTATAAPEPAQVQPEIGTAEIDNAATLVRQVLHMARQAPPGPEKDRLLAMGRSMFGAFTMACDAEMTREAANQSIRRAEIAYAQGMQSIIEMADYVRNTVQN